VFEEQLFLQSSKNKKGNTGTGMLNIDKKNKLKSRLGNHTKSTEIFV
jgi:hypothetical protein